jgi:hypothetical protein
MFVDHCSYTKAIDTRQRTELSENTFNSNGYGVVRFRWTGTVKPEVSAYVFVVDRYCAKLVDPFRKVNKKLHGVWQKLFDWSQYVSSSYGL